MLIPNVTSMPQAAVASFEYVINVGQSHLSVVSQSQTPSCLHFAFCMTSPRKVVGRKRSGYGRLTRLQLLACPPPLSHRRFKVLEVLNIEVQRDEHKGQRILLELVGHVTCM